MIARLAGWLRSLGRALTGRTSPEAEMDAEFRHHLALRAEDLVRGGMTPDAARRTARLEFGIPERYKHEGRRARGLLPFDALGMSWLDVKLAGRMLVKYPGLTVVGGLAMAFAIWLGSVVFALVHMSVWPTLPLAEGDRVVRLLSWDVAAGQQEERLAHDFVTWRGTLTSITELGAARDVKRNLGIEATLGGPVAGAEITASAFRLARVAPALGRTLVADDERPDAPPVVVLGHRVWQSRFAGDQSVVGRAVRIDGTYATVVGVMPEGFAFPESHELWTPLHLRPGDDRPREGPALRVFGRLAPGVTLDQARAELTTVGRRAAAELPETHARLRPQVVPYAETFLHLSVQELRMLLSMNVVIVMLLVLICGNVALLLFARAATRETELTVRSALGAGRGRIVAQLFAEALVLGALAATIGLAGAGVGLRWGLTFLDGNLGRLPFWFTPRLPLVTILYAAGLTVLAALVAGVIPALKMTRGLGARLRQGTAGGGAVRFGGGWTVVIVVQIAFTVAFPALVLVEQREIMRTQSFDVGFRDDEFLAVQLESDAPPPAEATTEAAWAAYVARREATLDALRRRVSDEPGVAGVTFAQRLPRTYYSHGQVEVAADDAAAADAPRIRADVSNGFVDPTYFDVLRMPVRAGRTFRTADADSTARAVIVNQRFVTDVLRGGNAVGRRVRFPERWSQTRETVEQWGPWLQIVGVVQGLDVTERYSPAPGVYFASTPGRTGAIHLLVHARGDPLSLVPRLRTIAGDVDPTLRLSDVQRLSDAQNGLLWFLGRLLRVTLALCAIALVLSLAGIYAVLSFTVARRTREIGVRVALGANRRRVIAAVFRGPLVQVGAGVAAGGAMIGAVALAVSGGGPSPAHAALLVAYVGLMLGVCLLACVVPTRRALAVQPTVALRADG